MKKFFDMAFLRAVCFALALQLLTVMSSILCLEDIAFFKDYGALVIHSVFCVIAVPMYFIVKKERSWKYTLIFAVFHEVLSVAVLFGTHFLIEGWDWLIVVLLEQKLLIAVAVILLCDMFFNTTWWRKLFS